MKVLHLSTTDIQGGAARGAFWLHKALQEQGVESSMFVDRKYSDDDTVVSATGVLAGMSRRVRARLDRAPLARYHLTQESFWSIGWVPHPIKHYIDRIAPDIVHLHWIGNGFLPISALSQIDCPIVWTLRDMWSFTGGCHYTAGCDRYRLGCGACPQLRSDDPCDLSARFWRRKQRTWHGLDLWLVPISSWLADCARASTLFDDHPIEVIPNGVDTRRFRAYDAADARAHWDLPQDRRLILFGGIDPLRDPRKGFAALVEALKHLAAQGWAERAMLVVFGATPEGTPPDCGLPTRFVGHISDDNDARTPVRRRRRHGRAIPAGGVRQDADRGDGLRDTGRRLQYRRAGRYRQPSRERLSRAARRHRRFRQRPGLVPRCQGAAGNPRRTRPFRGREAVRHRRSSPRRYRALYNRILARLP